MGLSKIVKNLQKLLDVDKKRTNKRVDAVRELVGKLEKKQVKLQDKLALVETEKETKRVKRHIKVCKAQLEKGRAALEVLQEDAE